MAVTWYIMHAIWFITEHRSNRRKDKRKTGRRKWGGANSLADDLAALDSGLAAEVVSASRNKTDSPRDKRTHRRTKRFLSYPRFVEVMVVADKKMVLYHGANLQHYVLTLMAIVSIFPSKSFVLLVSWGRVSHSALETFRAALSMVPVNKRRGLPIIHLLSFHNTDYR